MQDHDTVIGKLTISTSHITQPCDKKHRFLGLNLSNCSLGPKVGEDMRIIIISNCSHTSLEGQCRGINDI